MGVKTIFLYGILYLEGYIFQAKGFVLKGSKSKVGLLRKALYGLKQGAFIWIEKPSMCLYEDRAGLPRICVDSNLYLSIGSNLIVVLILYVDDLSIT